MRTEQIKIYTFDDLSESAKQKAIEKRRYWNVSEDWWTFTYDWFKETYPQYEDCEISHSGFSSQGDGASFTFRLDSAYFEKWVEGLDLPKWKKAILVHYTPQFYGKRNSLPYVHKRSVTIEFESEEHHYPNIDEFKEEVYPEFLAVLRSEYYGHCDILYKALEDEYNYRTSDECIIEGMEDCEFYESGETFY